MAKAGTTYKSEASLNADLKAGKLERIYFLFGEEHYLVELYTKRIISAAIGDGDADMNFMKFSGNPKADELSDFTDSLPFFSEHKCVLITDMEIDGADNAEFKAYLKIIEDLPETTVLIIAQNNCEVDTYKPKAKTKNLLEAANKFGCCCEMKYMSAAQVAGLAKKRAARSGCTLSDGNGTYLAELCGRSLTVVSNEVDKLCAYKNGGEITRADIDSLTPKLIDTSVYTLADELFAGRTGNAFHILDDVFYQQIEPIQILGALSGYFTDLYRAKLGLNAKKSYNDVAAMFKYPPNRAFVVRKAFTTVSRLSERYLADCIGILYDTNRSLNSSKADKRTLIEEALTRISSLER